MGICKITSSSMSCFWEGWPFQRFFRIETQSCIVLGMCWAWPICLLQLIVHHSQIIPKLLVESCPLYGKLFIYLTFTFTCLKTVVIVSLWGIKFHFYKSKTNLRWLSWLLLFPIATILIVVTSPHLLVELENFLDLVFFLNRHFHCILSRFFKLTILIILLD